MVTGVKIAIGFTLGVGVGVGCSYPIFRHIYTIRENKSVESVKESLTKYYESKIEKPTDEPKPKKKKEAVADDTQLHIGEEVHENSTLKVEPVKKPRSYNKRKNENVSMDKPKLSMIHALTFEEFNDFGDNDDSAGKVTLTYYSKDNTLVDEYGDILSKNGKSDAGFDWFADYEKMMDDTSHIYILDPKKNTAYMINKIEGRRGDFYIDDGE